MSIRAFSLLLLLNQLHIMPMNYTRITLADAVYALVGLAVVCYSRSSLLT